MDYFLFKCRKKI